MRYLFAGVLPVSLLLFCVVGCGDDSSTTVPGGAGTELVGPGTDIGPADPTNPDGGTSGSAATGSAASSRPDGAPSIPEFKPRKTLDGKWLLAFAQIVPPQQQGEEPQIGERTVLLVEAKTDDEGEGAVSVFAGRQGLENADISSSSASEGAIQFQVVNPQGDHVFEFKGTLTNGVVIGTSVFADSSVVVARLIPTEERTFARIPVLVPLPEAEVFKQLASSPVPDEDTLAFVEQLPTSPLGRFAYVRLVNITAGNKAPAEDLERVIDGFVGSMKSWGVEAALFSEYEALNAAVMAGYDNEWCLERCDAVEASLEANEKMKALAGQVDGLRKTAQYRQTMALVQSKEKADRERGRKLAEEHLQESPFDPVILVLLADDARENGRIDEAIQRYAELAVLPMQERVLQQMWADEAVQKVLPTERLATLWKEKNGGTEGLDEFRSKVYEEQLLHFADERREPGESDKSRRVVLCELFTGARCPPCVAADVALEGIEKTYPQSQVVTLRYHMHIPGHDPLTNEDTEARFYNFYRTNGTPRLFVNGDDLAGVGGVMPNAPGVYKGLTSVIEGLAEEKTEISIDVKVSRQGDSVNVSAVVEGLGEDDKGVRLQLVLAESDIHFEAFNGIRDHNMVVRSMIAGDKGVSPADGKLSFDGTVDIEKLREKLHSYLTTFEQNQGVDFVTKPLDLSNLSVVAFVQNVESRKVLQAVVVPVTGAVTAE